MHRPHRARRVALLGCLWLMACGSSPPPVGPEDPVQLGVIRVVDPARLQDPTQWGEQLELELEAEFWDLIGNSAHDQYPAWHQKAKAYVAANPNAHPRIALYVSAGSVFTLAQLFQRPDPIAGVGEFADFISDATVGARAPARALADREPAVVFFHNNQAMLAFLLQSDADAGICHLEKLRNLEDNPAFYGTEGRAAAPFTYGMVHDEAYVDYAIAMMEDCQTWVCMWTSEIAPFKPIGQIITLAELHAIKAQLSNDEAVRDAQYQKMNALLDRAEALGEARNYPFMDRIAAARQELPTRTYEPGLGLGRRPMPFYANETNCGSCHIGGRPGQTQVALDDPYPGADVITERPGPPPFMGDAVVDCDL